jgi:uncharacterized protein YndB with AHSA1/START domain
MQIEKKVHLKASQSRVWRAISDAEQFGSWFGMKVDGPFEPGKHMRGQIVPTKVDADVAKMQAPYEGRPFEIWIERIEPESLFSFRWHPFAIEKDHDYSKEPTTLVTFTLSPAQGGVLLTIVESGFENIPLERRAKAFEMNEGGWAKQCELVEKYLVQTA